MARSIADMREQPRAVRATRSERICLAPHLVAEVMSLTEELNALPVTRPKVGEDGERTGPPTKLAQKEHPRLAEVRERLAAVLDEMAEHEGTLVLRATDDGKWRQWVDANPARKEGEPGYSRDLAATKGICNADALIDDLATYAYEWEGDRLAEGDWQILADQVTGPDKKSLATAVVAMHENHTDFPAWRQGLQETLTALTASVSAANSGSAPAAS